MSDGGTEAKEKGGAKKGSLQKYSEKKQLQRDFAQARDQHAKAGALLRTADALNRGAGTKPEDAAFVRTINDRVAGGESLQEIMDKSSENVGGLYEVRLDKELTLLEFEADEIRQGGTSLARPEDVIRYFQDREAGIPADVNDPITREMGDRFMAGETRQEMEDKAKAEIRNRMQSFAIRKAARSRIDGDHSAQEEPEIKSIIDKRLRGGETIDQIYDKADQNIQRYKDREEARKALKEKEERMDAIRRHKQQESHKQQSRDMQQLGEARAQLASVQHERRQPPIPEDKAKQIRRFLDGALTHLREGNADFAIKHLTGDDSLQGLAEAGIEVKRHGKLLPLDKGAPDSEVRRVANRIAQETRADDNGNIIFGGAYRTPEAGEAGQPDMSLPPELHREAALSYIGEIAKELNKRQGEQFEGSDDPDIGVALWMEKSGVDLRGTAYEDRHPGRKQALQQTRQARPVQ